MATAVRSRGRKKTEKEGRKKEFVSKLDGVQLLGEIITWGLEEKTHTHQDVLNAMTKAGLSTAVAKAILPKHAFTRAQRKLAEDRVIDTVARDGDLISFQFTKRQMQSKEWVYEKECNLILNTATGQIECDQDKNLEAHAQRLLDQAIENRTTADITKIIQKLFDAEADLFPIRDQGGVYFVPMEFQSFVTKIETFVLGLGGRINRFPVPAGSPSGDKSVADTIFNGIDSALSNLNQATEEFTISTRQDTLANQAKYISECRIKVQAYASLLQDRVDELLDGVEHCNERLKKKLGNLEKERAEAPAEANGRSKFVLFNHSITAVLRWMGSKGWKAAKAKAVLDKYGIQVSDSTIGCQIGGWKERGEVAKLSDDQIKELEAKAEE